MAAEALLFAGCTKELEQRVDQLETDVEQLQSGLDALKKAVEDKLTVEDYKQIEGGYELLMSDGTKLYLYNGEDGANGKGAAEILPAEGVVSVTPESGAGYVDLYAINNTTGELKAKSGKTLATFTVTQKNYRPEWIADEAGEPVEWAETFTLSRYENVETDPSSVSTKKGVFTFELTDDPAKGAFKVVNMFKADTYFGENYQMVTNQGGTYYADIEL